jgi:hypothetical protein
MGVTLIVELTLVPSLRTAIPIVRAPLPIILFSGWLPALLENHTVGASVRSVGRRDYFSLAAHQNFPL